MCGFWISPVDLEVEHLASFLAGIDDESRAHLSEDVSSTDIRIGFRHALSNIVYNRDVRFLELDSNLAVENLPIQTSIDNIFDAISTIEAEVLLNKIKNSKSRIILSTSGTTGKPKEVSHTVSSLTRFLNSNQFNRRKVWLTAYNPYHIAGLQVFFQALFSDSSLLFFRQQNFSDLPKVISNLQVTHIACTPSFLRVCTPYLSEVSFDSVQSISLGGEKSDDSVVASAKKWFPHAKVKNVYALTEAGSLLSSDGVLFSISPSKATQIKIDDNGQLLVHRQVLGTITSGSDGTDWYQTGDFVEFIGEKFRIVGRGSDFINVGGMKVNPDVVERVISETGYVCGVIVRGRKSSILGQMVEAKIILNKGVDPPFAKHEIIKACRSRLLPYEVPGIIHFVKDFTLSNTGKAKRE